MATRATDKWTTASIPTADILLDPQNPRVSARANVSQKELQRLLLENADIVALARSIVDTNALMAGERIIVVKEDGQYVVVEGNRRTCASQLLLDPSFLPKDYRFLFPAVDETIRNRLTNLEADVAPSREAAEPIITRRHTGPGILEWPVVAKQQRMMKQIEAGKNIQEVSEAFGMSEQSVKRLIKEYRILEYARKLPGWTKPERDKLNSPYLKPNPFIRFFSLKGARDPLRMEISSTGEIESELPEEKFKEAYGHITRAFFFDDPDTGKPLANTRTTAEELYGRIFERNKALAKVVRAAAPPPEKVAGNGGSAAPHEEENSAGNGSRAPALKGQKKGLFFKGFVCPPPIQDNRLIVVSDEIAKIDHVRLPTSATFLLRALIERSLVWSIDEHQLWGEVMKQYGKNGKEPGLESIITFCRQSPIIFTDRFKSAMSHWPKIKERSDMVIHGNWSQANASWLESAADTIRPCIENIFAGKAFKKNGAP